jgi:hypothetical protein
MSSNIADIKPVMQLQDEGSDLETILDTSETSIRIQGIQCSKHKRMYPRSIVPVLDLSSDNEEDTAVKMPTVHWLTPGCSICRKEIKPIFPVFLDDNTKFMSLPCGHVFCKSCIYHPHSPLQLIDLSTENVVKKYICTICSLSCDKFGLRKVVVSFLLKMSGN